MEKIIYQCPNSCNKYSKSIEEIYQAGKKHKGQLVTCIEACEKQKGKISSLREEKNSLLEKVDDLEFELKEKSQLILKVNKETREMKIEIRNLHMERVEMEEFISKNDAHNEDLESLKVKVRDLEDEVFIKDKRISELEATAERSKQIHSNNLQQELQYVGKENEQLKVKIDALEEEIKKVKENEHKRTQLFKYMDTITEERKTSLKHLQEKIKNFKQKSVPKCRFGIECIRRFCRFDHSHVYRKVNKAMDKSEIESETLENVSSNYLCDICGKMLENIESKRQHMEAGHEELSDRMPSLMKCKECSSIFETRSDLNLHVIQSHGDDDIECEQCGKYFVTRSELNTHRKNHRNTTNEIEALNANLNFLLDEKKVPENEVSMGKVDKANFTCDQCDKYFVTKTSLKNHMKRQHKISNTNDKNPEEKSDDRYERYVPISKLKCSLCELRFINLEKMDDHMDSDHGGRWKLFDPDVVQLGEDYEESSESEESSSESTTCSEKENSETQSGEE